MPGSDKAANRAAKKINARIKNLEKRIKSLQAELKGLQVLTKKTLKKYPDTSIDILGLLRMTKCSKRSDEMLKYICKLIPGM